MEPSRWDYLRARARDAGHLSKVLERLIDDLEREEQRLRQVSDKLEGWRGKVEAMAKVVNETPGLDTLETTIGGDRLVFRKAAIGTWIVEPRKP